jgi:hypothetical protein
VKSEIGNQKSEMKTQRGKAEIRNENTKKRKQKEEMNTRTQTLVWQAPSGAISVFAFYMSHPTRSFSPF